ncbi:hypothetical protein KIN20_007407 [Parelaphostrongylus tenuis]|uniref:Uncharacterized protein n=1 Tax=Parelaphostrongylus tenuis TaxID=148309 RepID=A0AAD5MLG2_PARTN|nr:hypothetical protein KIN20_007407 [Parelaphostrongylus tenuis]
MPAIPPDMVKSVPDLSEKISNADLDTSVVFPLRNVVCFPPVPCTAAPLNIISKKRRKEGVGYRRSDASACHSLLEFRSTARLRSHTIDTRENCKVYCHEFHSASPDGLHDETQSKSASPIIQEDEQRAKEVLYKFVKDAINDVFEEEGRKYLLLPYVIEEVLKQITVEIEYTPMKCDKVLIDQQPQRRLVYDGKYKENCFVIDGTVVAICRPEKKRSCAITPVPGRERGREVPDPATNVPSEYLRIHGTLKTTNVFIASWTNLEWRRIFNRVQWFLADSNLKKDFFRVFIDFT